MPKGIRKIELMHQQFGRCDGHTCGECSNLTTHCYGRTYQKCLVYGESSSEASDWTKRWPACGMFNRQPTRMPVMQMVRRGSSKKDPDPEQPLDGQLKMEGF